MNHDMKRIVIDIDGTLCSHKKVNQSYKDLKPIRSMINKLIEYKNDGYYIILYTSRNMNTYNNNLGHINAYTSPELHEWLKSNNVPFDEIFFGKPWCGYEGFYVDDRAIRPSELLALSEVEIKNILENEKGLSNEL